MKAVPILNIEVLWEHYGGRIVGRPILNWCKATCPIHEDRHPSASVNTDTNRWRCFTCDKAGDGYELIQEIEGGRGRRIGFAEAKRIAEGIPGAMDGSVREPGDGGSGLLPRRPGARQGRRNWKPPWMRG